MPEPADPSPLAAQRKAFRKALATAAKRARRKADKLRQEIRDCESSDRWLRDGEAIKANLDKLQRGMTAAELPDPYDPQTLRVIELDPRLKPLDNAKRYFKKQRKLRDGLEAKVRELRLCAEEGDGLAALLVEFDTWREEAASEEALPEALLAAARERRVRFDEPRRAKGESAADAGARVREYVSHDGWALLVGKADRDNDYLTTRIARGNDWWFHVAGYPGSHVVARAPEGSTSAAPMADKAKRREQQSLPQETLLDAAHLAVRFSKIRDAGSAEVSYTQAKHVRKPKGAPAGQVTLAQHATIRVRMEERRLRRLLGGRE